MNPRHEGEDPMSEPEPEDVYVHANGISFHCVTAGEGPLGLGQEEFLDLVGCYLQQRL